MAGRTRRGKAWAENAGGSLGSLERGGRDQPSPCPERSRRGRALIFAHKSGAIASTRTGAPGPWPRGDGSRQGRTRVRRSRTTLRLRSGQARTSASRDASPVRGVRAVAQGDPWEPWDLVGENRWSPERGRFFRRGVCSRSVGRIAPSRGSTWLRAWTQGSQGSPWATARTPPFGGYHKTGLPPCCERRGLWAKTRSPMGVLSGRHHAPFAFGCTDGWVDDWTDGKPQEGLSPRPSYIRPPVHSGTRPRPLSPAQLAWGAARRSLATAGLGRGRQGPPSKLGNGVGNSTGMGVARVASSGGQVLIACSAPAHHIAQQARRDPHPRAPRVCVASPCDSLLTTRHGGEYTKHRALGGRTCATQP